MSGLSALEGNLKECWDRLSVLLDECDVLESVGGVSLDMKKIYDFDIYLNSIEELIANNELDEVPNKIDTAKNKLDDLYGKNLAVLLSNDKVKKRGESCFVNVDAYRDYDPPIRLELFVDEMLNLTESDYLLKYDGSIGKFFDKYAGGFKNLGKDDIASIIRKLYFKLDKLHCDYHDPIYEEHDMDSYLKTSLSRLIIYLNDLLTDGVVTGGTRIIKRYALVRDGRRKEKYYLREFEKIRDIKEHEIEKYDESGKIIHKERKLVKNYEDYGVLSSEVDTNLDGEYDKKTVKEHEGRRIAFK